MNNLKQFENYSDTNEVIAILEKLIGGYKVSDEEIDTIQDYYGYNIPLNLKHSGTVYRAFFVDDEDKYEHCLNNGVNTRRCSYFSVTKDDEALYSIVEQLGTGYSYYVIFEFNINAEDCLFDVNAMCDDIGLTGQHDNEQEVLVISDNIDKLTPDMIVSHGLVDEFNGV